jgi:hypothetical protein
MRSFERTKMAFVALTLSSILLIVLLFFDGLIFGVAARKGAVSIVLIIVGILLASFIGLSIPTLNSANMINSLENLIANTASRFGQIIYAFPLLWIIGFVVGLFV